MRKVAIQQSMEQKLKLKESDLQSQGYGSEQVNKLYCFILFAVNTLLTFVLSQLSAASPYYTTNTYWVPPASAIGSDQASKSSDATSDTMSCSDKSFEGLASHQRSCK